MQLINPNLWILAKVASALAFPTSNFSIFAA
jgi:hypothetical protein